MQEIFTENRLEKFIVLIFQLIFWWQYCQLVQFNSKMNIFTTVSISNPNFIFSNLGWLLYYLGGEFYLLGTLQNKLAAANPLIVVRDASKINILINSLMTVLLFSILYNFAFLSFIWILNFGKVELVFMFQLFFALVLSFSAFSLLILLCSLQEKIMGWIIMLVICILVLALKTNYLILISNNLSSLVNVENIFWFIVLSIILQRVIKKLEVR
ncbi:hypothetical protein OZX63_03540 [Lactobacillus sp. ESL0700]|uniref:hypothetical protein n=1 Tax=Lactobacillus sp. ESL0700 TaxID=2983216 RepID=UPI0023F6A87E|nr:hypothetical protein [Lactobacillus sp. ESL0700]WEV51783.1 hypothetical protein OZX63_03540 [Lactobacillus sp. ESL0700]